MGTYQNDLGKSFYRACLKRMYMYQDAYGTGQSDNQNCAAVAFFLVRREHIRMNMVHTSVRSVLLELFGRRRGRAYVS